MSIPLFRVNAFSDRFDGGNPAGVCLLRDGWLSDAQMQLIASENGWSETAFLLQRAAGCYDLRWFTPGCEVDLCGHATLAAACVLDRELGVAAAPYRFETRSGELRVSAVEDRYWLDLPVWSLHPLPCPDWLPDALGAMPRACYRGVDTVLLLEDAATVAALAPDHAALRRLATRGVCVTAPGATADIDFVSRWFGGPEVGIDEDPVTGSAHCALVPLWAGRLGRKRLEAQQLSSRGGQLSCRLDGDRVHVGGAARVTLRGELPC